MATIHFRIDKETKYLAMKAAHRHKKTLTELMRQRVEELAEEEREYQNSTDEEWLEQQINRAFSFHDAKKGDFISNDKMTQQMDTLETLAAQGKL